MKIAISSSELLLEVRCFKALSWCWGVSVSLLGAHSQQAAPIALFLKGSFPGWFSPPGKAAVQVWYFELPANYNYHSFCWSDFALVHLSSPSSCNYAF